jgi:hypothetical protein
VKCWITPAILAVTIAQSTTAQVRDSAGIRIVEHGLGTRAAANWSVRRLRAVRLVTPATAKRVSPEFVGASTLDDGSIVAASRRLNQLLLFNAGGTLITRFGGQGSADGAFGALNGVFANKDSIYGLDSPVGGMVFTKAGVFVRALPKLVRAHGTASAALGVMGDGQTVALVESQLPREARVQPVLMDLVRTGARSGDSYTLGQLIGRYQVTSVDYPHPIPMALGPNARVAVFPDRACFGVSDIYEITCVSSEGTPRLIIRKAVPLRPVAATERLAFRNAVLEMKDRKGQPMPTEIRSKYEALLSATAYPDHLPVYSRLLPSRTGDLWVQRYRLEDGFPPTELVPIPSTETHWDVFDDRGAFKASVILPRFFVPFEIGADYTLGILRPPGAVEQLQVLRLGR